jgi:hypothetical protein
VIPKGFILAFRNGFAPVKIFYAIPSPSFSADASAIIGGSDEFRRESKLYTQLYKFQKSAVL